MFGMTASPSPAPVATTLSSHIATTQLAVAQSPTILNNAAPPAPSLLSTINQKQQQSQTNQANALQNLSVNPALGAVASSAGLQVARPTQLEFGLSSPFLAQLLSQDIQGDAPTLQSFLQNTPANTTPVERQAINEQTKYMPSLATKPAPTPQAPVSAPAAASSAALQVQQSPAINNNPLTAQPTTQAASFVQAPILSKEDSFGRANNVSSAPPSPSLRNKVGVAAYQATVERTQASGPRATADVAVNQLGQNTGVIEAIESVKR